MKQGKVCVILPALNECETIGRVIDDILNEHIERSGYKLEILVADNGSTDSTRSVAEKRGAKVIVEPATGKGRAIRTAFESVNGDFIFMLDADYTYPATHISEMLEFLGNGYDVMMGSRLKGRIEDGAMSKMNLIGNHLLTLLANILYGTKISDLCTGYWGFRGAVVRNLKLDAIGFDLEANMFVEIVKKGYKIGEVPIDYGRRIAPPKLNSLTDGFKIGQLLIKKRFR